MTARTKTPPSPNEAPRDLTLHSDHVFTTDIRWLEGEVDTLLRIVHHGLQPDKINELSTHFTRYKIQQGYNRSDIHSNPKRLVRNSQIDEDDADADAEGEPEEDGADYWTLGPNGLIPINGAAPGPLIASSTGPTKVVEAPAPPKTSAGAKLRRSARIQQSRFKDPTKQIKSLRNQKTKNSKPAASHLGSRKRGSGVGLARTV
ncbi:hypothetical protein B0H14DRAFT_3461918 [Mycena olivaceomarginata]|nr:hypothetical protein B0H14DRAFT_3461918 [Mycena olivaceomarginata]